MSVNWRPLAVAGTSRAGVVLPPDWLGDRENLSDLESRFGKRGAGEFLALLREKDPELLLDGLLAFGRKLETSGRHSAAAEVYGFVANSQLDPSLALPLRRGGEVEEKARQCLTALQGSGTFSFRIENSLSRFVDQATDYRVIVPMLAGSAAFQLTKNLAWAGLLRSSSAGLLTRGLGAEGLAGLGAFGVEVSLFTGASRTLRSLSGAASENTWGQDWMGGALSLAALKGFHYAGARLQAGLAPNTTLSASSIKTLRQALIPQAALFLGLSTAHRVEEKLGWKAPSDGLGFFVDVLGSQLALQVGSQLGRGILGRGWTGFENELRLRGDGLRSQPVRPQLLPAFAAAAAGPGNLNMMAVKTPLEKLFGWVGERMSGRPADPPSASEQLKPIFQQYPKLKKALNRARWSPEQKLALFNMLAGHAEQEIGEVFQYLPAALGAMVQNQWAYERQYSFLEMLALKGDFFRYRIRHISTALTAVHKLPDSVDDKYRFVYELGDLSGPYADRVFGNLPQAIRTAQNQSWPLDLTKQLFGEIIRNARSQAGVALDNLDPTLTSMLEEFWSLEMKIQMIGILSRPAIDDMTMAWRFTDGFPLALGQMLAIWGPSDLNHRLLVKVFGEKETGMDEALNFFPGSLQSLVKLGWEPNRIYDYISEAAHKAGEARGRVFRWTPYFAHGLKARHVQEDEIQNLMLDFAERAPDIPEYAFVGFLDMLFKQNASLKRWEN